MLKIILRPITDYLSMFSPLFQHDFHAIALNKTMHDTCIVKQKLVSIAKFLKLTNFCIFAHSGISDAYWLFPFKATFLKHS